jgi:hypothetical protein
MNRFSLPRTKQCAKCPWKVSTNPHDIPDGYCEIKHAGLAGTIAKEGELNIGGTLRIMACHHSDGNDKMYCIGWLKNQLGVGNNIGLRISMMQCENLKEMKVYGKQHERFEDTLPKHIEL